MNCIGVDIIEIPRIARAIARWRDRFLHRIYTQNELQVCQNRTASLAARFAAKEAVMKALGTGRNGIGWQEVEVLRDATGKPVVCLHGRAKVRAQKLNLQTLIISLSHSRDYAIALVAGGSA